MSAASIYTLRSPTSWAEPPDAWSTSSLDALRSCVLRWQLLRSTWGELPRFPERLHPAAIEGQIVHEALDLLGKALVRRGRPAIGSPAFQLALAECDFWAFFGRRLEEWNRRLSAHPRSGPFFLLRNPAQDLANRAIRLFREQYRPGGLTAAAPPTFQGASEGACTDPLPRLRALGTLSELRLAHPSLPFIGVLDLVRLEGGRDVSIVDYKTGAAKAEHQIQLLRYALLWWRATGEAPTRISAQYLHEAWEAPVTLEALVETERSLVTEIESATKAAVTRPGQARVGSHCAGCPVRARCDTGWSMLVARGAPAGTLDLEITVGGEPTPGGFPGLCADGKTVAVAYDVAVGKGLPALTDGQRVRILDAVSEDGGAVVEVKPWTEVYII